MKLFNLVFLFILFADVAYGYGLADLQQMALGNRDIIKKYYLNLEKSVKSEKIARSGYYPSLDISYTANSLDESTTYENKENSSGYAAITWNLFDGFADKYNVDSTGQLREAEEYKLKGIKQDINLNIALRYIDTFNRKAKLSVDEDQFNLLEKLYKDAENRYQVGLIDKNSLLKFKVDLDDANITLKRSKADLAKSLNFLNREIGAHVALKELSFSEFDTIPVAGSAEKYEADMLANRSEIKVLEKRVEAAKMKVKVEQASYYPQVDVTTSYLAYSDDYRVTGDNSDDEMRAQLVLSLNLFDGFATKNNVDIANIDVQSIQYDLEELKNDMRTELANQYLDYEVSVENTKVAKESIKQAQENLRATSLKYKEGLQRESDLLDAIANLTRAKYNHVLSTTSVFIDFYRLGRMTESL